MNTALLASVLTLTASPIPADAAAVELQYTGRLVQRQRLEADREVKEIGLYALVTPAEDQRMQLTYILQEQGASRTPWPQQFGQLTLTAENQQLKGLPPDLLYEHNGNEYPITLPCPLFEHLAKLDAGADWQTEELTFAPGPARTQQDRVVRDVEAFARFGRSHTLTVDTETGLILDLERRLFMGQGDEFRLTLKLQKTRELDQAALERIGQPIPGLLALQQRLLRAPGDTRRDFSVAQLALIARELPELQDAAKQTPFASLVDRLSRASETQSRRGTRVAQLTEEYLGKAVADRLQLTTLQGQAVDAESLKDQIVVLHFWSYQHEPLTAPYGQVGYLDFLNRRRSKMGVKFFGVAVNDRFGDPTEGAAALRSVRKLRELMNLSYDVTIDDGTLLRQFGDPRRFQADLPLWVVVAPDGAIVHYKVGLYHIDPDEGLQELDAALIKQIRARRAAE